MGQRGRRVGKLSNLHLGALDAASGEYVMLGKTFKGLTDAMLEWQTRVSGARDASRSTHRRYMFVRNWWPRSLSSDLQASRRYP